MLQIITFRQGRNMCVVYTDNQPDFSWLMSEEEKTFSQYFISYRDLGRDDEAYDAFYKSVWNASYQEMGYSQLARLTEKKHNWELSVSIDNQFPTAHRNLALAYFNKLKAPENVLKL